MLSLSDQDFSRCHAGTSRQLVPGGQRLPIECARLKPGSVSWPKFQQVLPVQGVDVRRLLIWEYVRDFSERTLFFPRLRGDGG